MRALALALLIVIAQERACTLKRQSPIAGGTAESFRATVGVNSHLQYDGTAYHSLRVVQASLDYLGVSNVRDSGLRRGWGGWERYVELGRQGVHFDVFFNATDFRAQLDRVGRLAKVVPGSILTLEGPNEINNDPIRFAGRSGVVGAKAYQAVLYEAAHHYASLQDLPVLNYTNWPPTGGRADAVNVHSYPGPSEAVYRRLTRDLQLGSAALPTHLPLYVTETGSPTGSISSSARFVSREMQASTTLVTLFEAYRAGVRRTFLYELLDEGRRDPVSDPEMGYGLFDAYGRPKLSAQALADLMRELKSADDGPREPDAPEVHVQGAESLVLRGRSGRAVLALWRRAAPATPPSIVSVSLSKPATLRESPLDLSTSKPLGITAHWTFILGSSPHLYVLTGLAWKMRPRAPSSRPVATS